MAAHSENRCYIGIDVGTASARAGIFTANGVMLGCGTREIRICRPQDDFVEQSSDDIWRACGAAVKEAMSQAGIDPKYVRGIGFDATCSLVALDAQDRPVSVSPTGQDEQNVVVWMDHRAVEQAQRINATGHHVLRYVGGTISPEMQLPKLLWLKENLPDTWRRAALFFDLPDFLTYRATGDDTRSLCTTVCKWTYLGHESPARSDAIGCWDDSFFRGIGLADLVEEGYQRIGTRVRPMGEPVADGLTETAARELGLNPGTPVGVAIIDAHAGGLGVLGAPLEGIQHDPESIETRLALVGGTSSCHMAVSRAPRFVNGVWGPYFAAMIPGMWLTEGGQSATGALIDHVIFSHVRAADLQEEAAAANRTVYEVLNDRLEALARNVDFPARLTRDLHVLPYFHGNRSPRADPTLRGAVSGLKLSNTIDDLALLYLSTIQAIAHGTRHIIDTLNGCGYAIDTIMICGGGTKNPVFLREHADIIGSPVVLPREPEAVLLGSAVLGAVAAGDCGSVMEAMSNMSVADRIITPAYGVVGKYQAAKHAVFLRMYEDHIAYRSLIQQFDTAE